ncbi:hypothetical protein, partial [Microbacterium sp.]|uniref:hypothetical protein n=1 Tax=Microbacterium sp. TaxID=51671 RepID=UPI003A84CF6B
GQGHHNPVGRTPDRERAIPLATSGHICWPPMGKSYWPLTRRLSRIESFHEQCFATPEFGQSGDVAAGH